MRQNGFKKFNITRFGFQSAIFLFGLTSIGPLTSQVYSQTKATNPAETADSQFTNDGLRDADFVFANPAKDDPTLPRYLCIGDSISSNYSKAIIDLHAGKLNSYHPPTNCGSSTKGRAEIRKWLGDYEEPGQQWDVISFNFGHWDANETKEVYQDNLLAIIDELKKTNARLVWVTTCPVPFGYGTATKLTGSNAAPGRKAGVIRKFLNPWAEEVIDGFPEITICDQWQFLYDRADVYQDWWQGNDVHFDAEPAYAIGRLLAQHVLERVGMYREPGYASPEKFLKESMLLGTNLGWRPPEYNENITGQFYSNAATARAVPSRWSGAERLVGGFSNKDLGELSKRVPDRHGWLYELGEISNHLQLKAIKTARQKGIGLLSWHDSTGRESTAGVGVERKWVDAMLLNSKDKVQQQDFSDSYLNKNVSDLYDLHRISRDRYYSDRIIDYAELMEEAFVAHASLEKQVQGEINFDHLWAHVIAARLILEQARIDRADAEIPKILLAKKLLSRVCIVLDDAILGEFESPFLSERGAQAEEFTPGPISKWLVEERRVPQRGAQLIECQPWHETMRLLSALTAATRALEELNVVQKEDTNKDRIANYRRMVAGGLGLFQVNNLCISNRDKIYFFHSRIPNRKLDPTAAQNDVIEMRLPGPTISEANELLWHLTFIWEANQSFGCPTKLLVAYGNTISDQFDFATSGLNHSGSTFLYPRDRIDSPWYIAATGGRCKPAERLAENLIFMTAFSPGILKSHQAWTVRHQRNESVQLLKAAMLYREWRRRKSRE